MVHKNLKLQTALLIINIFVLTGCSTHSQSLINTTELNTLNKAGQQETGNSNYEMVKLRNGVIVYKDKSTSRKSKSNSSSSDVNFGPREIEFDVDPFERQN